MKSIFSILMIGLLLPTGVLAQDEPIFDKTQQSAASRGAEEYAMVYFIENYRWNYVTITYPDGSTDYD